ncbi:hypothetical protein [Sphingobacterium siyangense]|uniref:hypothetical protein n=1 Tax=Sphingobacterium siyangense TaxID=459529 RepID=UPI001964CEE7|nr:hypothetical protein [Sphingobacterium siyangense]QRY55592.1 hypothetical protein JVX97_16270 [Sphingobacterium siyangense]
MYKKVALFHFLLFFYSCFAQTNIDKQKSILIYSDDSGYMQPFVEKTIKNLQNIDTDSSFFTSVHSFNRFISDNKYQAELNNLILTQKPNNIKINPYYSESEKQIRNRIFEILNKYDYFLTVKTNTLGELIEFQFQLYETVSSENTVYNISDRVLSVENFFINPKEKDYKVEITNALQRLFKKSNRIPEAELKIFDQFFNADSGNNKIVLPIDISIMIDGSNSGDNDTEIITYHWRNIIEKNEKYQTTKKLIFQDNSPIQNVKIKESGEYKIGFKVFDGIDYSKEVVINIIVREKPYFINVVDTTVYSKKLRTIIPLKSNRKFFGKIYVSNFTSDTITDKLILSKNPVSQKNVIDIKRDLLIEPLKIKKDNFYSYPYIEFDPGDSGDAISERRTYYLYNVDDDGNLHNQKVINHLYLVRGFVSFRFNFVNAAMNFNREDESGTSYQYCSLAVGFHITNNLELELALPFGDRKEENYKNHNFQYPHSFEVSANYLFFDPKKRIFGQIIPYLGFNLKSFYYKFLEDEIYSQTYSVGPKAGCEYSLTSWRMFDLDLRLNVNYDIFTEKTFNGINSGGLGVSAVIKL